MEGKDCGWGKEEYAELSPQERSPWNAGRGAGDVLGVAVKLNVMEMMEKGQVNAEAGALRRCEYGGSY